MLLSLFKKSNEEKDTTMESVKRLEINSRNAQRYETAPTRNPILKKERARLTKEDFLLGFDGKMKVDFKKFFEGTDEGSSILIDVTPEALVHIKNFLENEDIFNKINDNYQAMIEQRIESGGMDKEVEKKATEKFEAFKDDFLRKINKDGEVSIEVIPRDDE